MCLFSSLSIGVRSRLAVIRKSVNLPDNHLFEFIYKLVTEQVARLRYCVLLVQCGEIENKSGHNLRIQIAKTKNIDVVKTYLDLSNLEKLESSIKQSRKDEINKVSNAPYLNDC